MAWSSGLTRRKLSHRPGRRKWQHCLPFFEIAGVLVRVDYRATFIENANHRTTEEFRLANRIADRIRLGVPQATERQRIGN
jgi:hypothetical protein